MLNSPRTVVATISTALSKSESEPNKNENLFASTSGVTPAVVRWNLGKEEIETFEALIEIPGPDRHSRRPIERGKESGSLYVV